MTVTTELGPDRRIVLGTKKWNPPPVRPELIARDRLLEQLVANEPAADPQFRPDRLWQVHASQRLGTGAISAAEFEALKAKALAS
jgi:hypothetical protein